LQTRASGWLMMQGAHQAPSCHEGRLADVAGDPARVRTALFTLLCVAQPFFAPSEQLEAIARPLHQRVVRPYGGRHHRTRTTVGGCPVSSPNVDLAIPIVRAVDARPTSRSEGGTSRPPPARSGVVRATHDIFARQRLGWSQVRREKRCKRYRIGPATMSVVTAGTPRRQQPAGGASAEL